MPKGHRAARNDHFRNCRSLGEFAGMKTSCSAKGHQSKVAGIVSALDGNDAQCALHIAWTTRTIPAENSARLNRDPCFLSHSEWCAVLARHRE